MVEHGHALAERRTALVAMLDARLAAAPVGAFARAGLALSGFDKKVDFAPALATSRARDAAAGRTLAGPHRQDLQVVHLDKAMPAAAASTGEQKALLLSMVLAHAALVADQRDTPPILLLDEVAAHLDPARRAALFDRLATTGAQVWMTGTEAALFDEIGPTAELITVGN
mgnify:CR=1 FL=1